MEYCCKKFEEYHFDLFYLKGDEVEKNEFVEETCMEHVKFSGSGMIGCEFVEISFCPFCGTNLLQLMNKAVLTLANHTA